MDIHRNFCNILYRITNCSTKGKGSINLCIFCCRLNLLNWQENWIVFFRVFSFFQMCGYFILRSLSVTFVDYFMIMVEWRENAELQNVSDYQFPQNRSIWSLCNSHISCCQKNCLGFVFITVIFRVIFFSWHIEI